MLTDKERDLAKYRKRRGVITAVRREGAAAYAAGVPIFCNPKGAGYTADEWRVGWITAKAIDEETRTE